MCLNYKKYKRIICENGDMLLQSMTVGEKFPTVSDLMAAPLAKYISLAVSNCEYGGTAEDFIVNYVHPLFLKSKSAASREDNMN